MNVRAATVPFRDAWSWSSASLHEGSAVAGLVSRRLSTPAAAFVVGPESAVPPKLDDDSRSMDQRDADHLLGEYFQWLASLGDSILVVEDDTAREGDPLGDPWLADVAFVEGRVLRWKAMQAGAPQLTQLIRRGSSGYPLNAYVCDGIGKSIFQRARGILTLEDASSLAQSARAVIHSVYDAEGYLVIEFSSST